MTNWRASLLEIFREVAGAVFDEDEKGEVFEVNSVHD